jgi:ribonuclease D
MRLAPALVGTSSDMKDLLAWKLGCWEEDEEGRAPLLATGWRAEVVGTVVDELLSGRASLRIGDLRSPDPLVIDRRG